MYLSKEFIIFEMFMNFEKNGEKIFKKVDQESVRVVESDEFDVQNVEMFVQMMGFDLNLVMIVDSSEDSDSVDILIFLFFISNLMYEDFGFQVLYVEMGLLKLS